MPSPSDPDPSHRRYSTVAILLHWTIAILIVVNIVIALNADELKGLAKFSQLQWHKSFGLTVLVLTALRFLWRLANPPPAYPAHMARWEKAAATVTHLGFYLLTLAIPLTGWAMVSASPLNIPTLLFKTIPWPHIGFVHSLPMIQRKGLEGSLTEVHQWLAWGMLVLLALHVAAALKHQFRDRDWILWGMFPLPALKPGPAKQTEV